MFAFSPEICQNKPYGTKSDMWSLGVVLYEMITLKHPFDANSMEGLLNKIVKGSYAPISKQYSSDLRQLVDSLLQKNPSQRPSINSLLSLPFLQSYIVKHLSHEQFVDEFSHTVLHANGKRNGRMMQVQQPINKQAGNNIPRIPPPSQANSKQQYQQEEKQQLPAPSAIQPRLPAIQPALPPTQLVVQRPLPPSSRQQQRQPPQTYSDEQENLENERQMQLQRQREQQKEKELEQYQQQQQQANLLRYPPHRPVSGIPAVVRKPLQPLYPNQQNNNNHNNNANVHPVLQRIEESIETKIEAFKRKKQLAEGGLAAKRRVQPIVPAQPVYPQVVVHEAYRALNRPVQRPINHNNQQQANVHHIAPLQPHRYALGPNSRQPQPPQQPRWR